MKTLIRRLCCVIILLLTHQAAMAADALRGKFAFHTFCAVCHITVQDLVIQQKARTAGEIATAIQTIDRMGDLRRLSVTELEDIAAFVRAEPRASTFVDFSGVWISPAEPGWGLTIAHQASNNRAFIVLYIYNETGQQRWLTVPESSWDQDNTVLTGKAFETRGGTDLARFNPRDIVASAAGQVTLVFRSERQLELVYAVPGRSTTTKTMTRFVF